MVLFLIGANLLASSILKSQSGILAQVLILCLFALIFVFFAGWFEVIKNSTQREKIKEKNFYSIFLEGIGLNVIPSAIGIVVYTVLVFLAVFLAQFIALKFFGDINFFLNDLNKISLEGGNFAQYFNSLDVNQKYIVYGWNLCIIASVLIFNFLSLFYFPAIFYCESNIFLRPFIAIYRALGFLFKNFFAALALGIIIYILNMLLAFLNAAFAQNAIISVLLLLVYIYFISWVVMLIFNYYEAKNNSSDRSNSVGENSACDTVSEEN
ncbi:hypothetical protein IJ531_06460 [bacterium]|nr:hypothetical protein [bacterium]